MADGAVAVSAAAEPAEGRDTQPDAGRDGSDAQRAADDAGAVDPSIDAVIEAAKKPGHAPEKAILAPVKPWLLRVAASAGFDLSGYSHTLHGSVVRHALKSHGDPKAEARRGQLQISDDDCQSLPSPDRIVFGTKNRLNKDQIAYPKKMDDGSVLYFEEIRTGRKELAAVTLRKYPATINVDSVLSTLNPNARSDGSDLKINGNPSSGKESRAQQSPSTSSEQTPFAASPRNAGEATTIPSGARRGISETLENVQSAATPAQQQAANFAISADDEIGQGGAKTKFANNVAAIRLLRVLQQENGPATREEQATLAKWVGWGGLREAFGRDDGSGWGRDGRSKRPICARCLPPKSTALPRHRHATRTTPHRKWHLRSDRRKRVAGADRNHTGHVALACLRSRCMVRQAEGKGGLIRPPSRPCDGPPGGLSLPARLP